LGGKRKTGHMILKDELSENWGRKSAGERNVLQNQLESTEKLYNVFGA